MGYAKKCDSTDMCSLWKLSGDNRRIRITKIVHLLQMESLMKKYVYTDHNIM